MGIEAAHIEAIIEAHTETVDALKAQRDSYKEAAEKADDLEERLRKVTEDGEAENGRLAELQAKYDEQASKLKELQKERKELQDQFDGYKADIETKEATRAKRKAYRSQVLEAAGISSKYLDDVMRVADIDSVEIDEDGNVRDSKELVEGVKEKFRAFVSRKRTDAGAPETPPAPPVGKGGVAGAHPRAVEINREYHERMYGKREE